MQDWSAPGQRWQRIALVLLLPVAGWSVWRWWGGSLHGAAALVLSIATFLFVVLSFEALHRGWMAFGERANRVMVGLLFALIYTFVVPLFSLVRLKDRLRMGGGGRRSFWVERAPSDDTLESMLRLG